MAGMLEQATQQPSSGPETQTPPVAASGAGVSPRDSATGPGQPQQDAQALRDQAIQLVYGERFDQLIKMFKTNGAEKFPRSMAVAINTAFTELEKNGPISPEVAAEVGMDLMMKLMEDIISGGVLPDVTLAQAQEALPATLVMYADSHPDVSKEDVQMIMQEVQRGVSEQDAPAPDVNAPPAEPAGGE